MLLIPKFIVLKTLFPFLAFLLAWDMTWKWIALYKAAQKKEVWRFICLLIFNTCGLLPIIYLLIDCTKNEDTSLKKEHKTNTEIKQAKMIKKGGLKWNSEWENGKLRQEKKQKKTPESAISKSKKGIKDGKVLHQKTK